MKRSLTILLVNAMAVLFSTHSYGQKPQLSVYGYFDLVARDFSEREFPNGATENPAPTFLLLRTHILLNSKFSEDWGTFVNVRFQSGADLGAGDHEDKGEIELLETWFEYRYSEGLRIRGGQFLAPFGYFNTRKFQSPIFNTVVLPAMYEEEFLRRAAAGTIIPPLQNLQLLGEFRSETWRLGYNFYMGNGSTTNENNLDLNANKSVGARLWIEPTQQNLAIGASFFAEKGVFGIRPHVDMKAMMTKALSLGLTPNKIVPILPTVTESETRRTWGVDVRYVKHNFEVRGEFVKSSISDLSLVDASTISDTTQTYTFNSSNFSKTFYYVHLNYTFLEKLTPYFEINVFEDPRHFVFRNELRRLAFGCAFRPHSHVAIKAEFHDHLFGEKFNKKPRNFKNFQMFWTAVSVFFN